ncbi:MAG: hypothetical protein NWQ23_11130 [Yoonia sp.]|uniref:hypothetical protein n=1 Tax=Yoonia sp. TaxID=2212373 RepID=UPI00273DDB32|nr:hypothetical protein [Yoonia sp.]MDP5085964.1 hypothetical protein [Yoonia sp.]MDP5360653.1 hypothetical protein [Paracoccaceae bacterium]
MSDLNALAQKISALTAQDVVFEAGSRVISQGGSPAPLDSVLAEIDDTVLERNLEFTADTQKINLIVAGRRLRGVLAVSSMGAEDVIGKTVSREEPDLLLAVADLISSICSSANRLTVRSLAPEPFGTGGERGISAQGLAEIWQVETDQAPQTPMGRFLNTNKSAFSAVLHVVDDEIVATFGDFDTLQTIWETQVAAFQARQKKTLNADDGPQLICFDGALEDGTAAALALADEDVVLIAYPANNIGAVHSSWRAIFG